MKIVLAVLALTCAVGVAYKIPDFVSQIIGPGFGGGPSFGLVEFFQNFIGNFESEEDDCDFFPFIGQFGNPELTYIADQLNCWMCSNNKLLMELAQDMRLLLQVTIEMFSDDDGDDGDAGNENKEDCEPGQPAPPPPATVFISKEDEFPGIALLDVDSTGGYVLRDYAVVTTFQPYYMIVSRDGNQIFTAEDNGEGVTNLTCYFRDPCDGKYEEYSWYDFNDVFYYMALDVTETYVVTAGYENNIISLFYLDDDRDWVQADTIDPQAVGLPNSLYPYDFVFSPRDSNVVAIAMSGINRVSFYAIDSVNDKLTFLFKFDMDEGTIPISLCFSQNGDYLYVQGLLTAFTYVYKAERDTATQMLTNFVYVDKIDTQEPFENLDSDSRLVLHPNGNFLYSTIIGHNSVTVFRVDQSTGKLTFVDKLDFPSHYFFDFVITPNGNQALSSDDDYEVNVYTIDKNTGIFTILYVMDEIEYPESIVIRSGLE